MYSQACLAEDLREEDLLAVARLALACDETSGYLGVYCSSDCNVLFSIYGYLDLRDHFFLSLPNGVIYF